MISGKVQNRKFRQNTEHENYESSIYRSREKMSARSFYNKLCMDVE